jgi:DNA invertase Pin-like site-specific DNA recombinase
MAGVVAFEREPIKGRQREGIAVARKVGVYKGGAVALARAKWAEGMSRPRSPGFWAIGAFPPPAPRARQTT